MTRAVGGKQTLTIGRFCSLVLEVSDFSVLLSASNLFERLGQILNLVVDMLDPNRNTHQVARDTH